jgi:general secretion pathway protein E
LHSEPADPELSALPPRDGWLLRHLLESEQLGADDAEHIAMLCRTQEEPLPKLLIRLGVVPEKTLTGALAEYHGTRVINQDDLPEKAISGYDFSAKFLRGSEILPLWERDGEIFVAMAEPADSSTADSIKMICEMPVQICAASRSVILEGIERLYGPTETETAARATGSSDHSRWRDRIADSPVAMAVNDLIVKAVGDRASDLHLEQTPRGTRARYRIDGVLHDVDTLDGDTGVKACARIKLISNLDVAERRLPQDGRFQLDVDGKAIDIRVSSVPINSGESIVLRILHRSHARIDMSDLGFSNAVATGIHTCIKRSSGLIMVTGPTGSGKSTTLYSALETLNSTEKKLITVEDPVEYDLPGINQIQVRPELQLNFATTLRSVLRQDPDIIMVGEVRDAETAEISIQAALTGHMVLTTVHTNDAAASFPRLMDMGVEPYLLASTVTGVLAQRLVRRLCRDCREQTRADTQTIDWLGENGVAHPEAVAFRPVGCSRCAGTGYRGRSAIGEFIRMDENLARLIRHEQGVDAIRTAAIEGGTVPLLWDAARCVNSGDTTMEEVFRSVG